MTSLLEPLIGDSCTAVDKDANHNIRRRHCKHVLKSKENTLKIKCKKNLKRKLKKYKLRQDGKEDQDILDVSESLISSLFIRSPNKVKDSGDLEIEQLRPKNYLFRMVRPKQTTLKSAVVCKGSDIKPKVTQDDAAVPILSSAVEEKKQTNAFRLLMESRNKSIGTNSPGKDKQNNEPDQNSINEKKSIKAKRNLMLQKMAEQKGSLKKREIEEQQEKYIKKKMEKRADKLKNMLLHKEPIAVKEKVDNNKQKTRSPLDSIDAEKNEKVLDKSINTIQLVNIFEEADDKKAVSKKKSITKEDEEFLEKLSPSIKKKESMLSYFKKIEKDPDVSNIDAENNSAVIKVKLRSKSKKKGRKKKLSLKRDAEETCVIVETMVVNTEVVCTDTDNKDKDIEANGDIATNCSESSIERRKRKREAEESSPCLDDLTVKDCHDKRPKRSVKRPVKYNDDVVLSSSDEELHIFTPKKKKQLENKKKSEPKSSEVIVVNDTIEKSNKKLNNNEKVNKKEKKPAPSNVKPVKLAPIFAKPQIDLAAIEAKQKFLQSGIPEQLKKLICKQKICSNTSNTFPTVVHVQQLDFETSVHLPPIMNLEEEVFLENLNLENSKCNLHKLLNLELPQSAKGLHCKNNVNTQITLQRLKESYPKFPVYRIYKLLRSRKKGEYKGSNIFFNMDNSVEILNCSIEMQNDNPDQLTWSDKYKPLSGDEIIGNFDNVKELKKWLVNWTENNSKSKATLNNSDSSDYYESDTDSRDSTKSYNNLLILSGPVGCGKTSSVYAVAAELSMKVIEVNASGKRTGKIMLQDLHEATQSHKVNRGTGSSENSQKSQDLVEALPEVTNKKRGRPKKVVETLKQVTKERHEVISVLPASQESTRTAMSLILIDDADIVFDQDDGFCSAIMQLVQCSKRPVILVTGSLTLPHIQKFLQCSKILKMKPLLPNMLGTWLDLMCLADCGNCWPGMGAKFLNFFKGDMRKTINCLQFYVSSQEQDSSVEINTQTDSQNGDEKINVDDENSCMSWTDRDTIGAKNSADDSQPIWDTFLNDHTHLKYLKCPLNMFDIWWSIPKILKIESTTEHVKNTSNNASLESISSLLDAISVCDFLSLKSPETEANLTSRPWSDAECDSVSELENFANYDRKDDITKKICCDLLVSTVTMAQKNMELQNTYDIEFPRMSLKRQRDRIVTRHTDLASYLIPQSLDRRALALDYWSTCRAICRVERSKTDSVSKRNNRFCHYLKSLSALSKSESFDSLANSLNPSGSS